MNGKRLWLSDQEDGTYINPILFADYSDPDVIRVGKTFYMTASSFNYTPGLPILTSKDLVNWKLCHYAVKNLPGNRFAIPAHSEGVWAPAIRYHDNRFWIFFGMPDEGIYMVQADDPLGPWSEPYLLLAGKGYIDPCPFWDEDGRAYIIHAYAKSRIGYKSILGMFEITSDGRKVIGDDHFIYDGNHTQPTIEGPKVHKRHGWYYIFAPAGGVTHGWQTVLRSKSIEGPYEEKIVLTSGGSPVNGPHQGAWVDTPSGEDWFVHFQDKGVYGRITHLQPMTWGKDGWPVIGVNPDVKGCGKPQAVGRKPLVEEASEVCYLAATDTFSGTSLGLQWQWLGNHSKDYYSLLKETMTLRLYALNPSNRREPTLWISANVLTQKIICPAFEARTTLNISGLKYNEQAGMVMMGGQYAYIAVRKDKLGVSLVYVVSENQGTEVIEKVYHRQSLDMDADQVTFKIILDREAQGNVSVTTAWAIGTGPFQLTGHKFRPKGHHWVGGKLGIFTLALDQHEDQGYGDFEYFKVDPLGEGGLRV